MRISCARERRKRTEKVATEEKRNVRCRKWRRVEEKTREN